MKKEVGIIGAGVSGLALAVRLARMGWTVTVFEASPVAGGKLGELRRDGFRFDTGPSLFTLPELLTELLDDDLRPDMERLDIVTRYFFEDGLCLNAYGRPERFASEVEEKTGEKASKLMAYLTKAAWMYRLTAPVFIFGAIHRWRRLFSFQNLWRALQFPRLQVFANLHQKNKLTFRDRRLVQLFDRFATYNGSDPYRAPATLQVIAHLEHNLGAWLPKQGMRVVAEALYAQAVRLGVHFRFSFAVEAVRLLSKDQVQVFAGVERFNFNLVVSAIDVTYFYQNILVKPEKLKPYKAEEPSTSALIFYWGMNRNYPKLEVHSVFFAADYVAEFESLFRQKTICDDPTVYVYVSSKQNEADAPAGMENWFVMVNAPVDVGQNWEELIAETRRRILQKLERMLGEAVETHICCEQVLDPPGIFNKTSSVGGAIYGPSSNNLFSAFKRHPNYRDELPGVYFTGGSVHPGGGIPLCLASAKIVAGLIEEKEGAYVG